MRITRWVERVDSGVCLEKQVFLEPRSNSGLAGCARSWAAKKRRRKNMCPNENEGRVEVLQDCVLEDIKEEEPLVLLRSSRTASLKTLRRGAPGEMHLFILRRNVFFWGF
ncbi:uncharacterized protein LOC144577609 isoform X2 [Callithrix jacchus]